MGPIGCALAGSRLVEVEIFTTERTESTEMNLSKNLSCACVASSGTVEFLDMNIVFDLGRVVVRWEPEALLAQTFADAATRNAVHSGFIEHADWLELDRGTMAPQEAVERAAQRLGIAAPALGGFLQKVPAALEPIPETVALLYRLKTHGHALYCLSNMHFASIEFLEGAHSFWEVFSGKVISCRVNLCKPEAKIYAHLLETYGLDAAQTVFVDDVEANVAAARQFGIRTIRFENSAQCADELKVLGCL